MVRLSCSVSLGTNFYRSPKRNCRGVSMGVDLGLAFCPGAMGLDTSGHRVPGRRIGLGSSPWFPGVSLPSCAKPNKLLNNHECWVLFQKGHESTIHCPGMHIYAQHMKHFGKYGCRNWPWFGTRSPGWPRYHARVGLHSCLVAWPTTMSWPIEAEWRMYASVK